MAAKARNTTKAQSSRSKPPQHAADATDAALPSGQPVVMGSSVSVDIASIEQKVLARECKVSTAFVSRLLSHKYEQRRKDPKLSTMLKLQAGLEKLTGRHYTLDSIGELIRP